MFSSVPALMIVFAVWGEVSCVPVAQGDGVLPEPRAGEPCLGRPFTIITLDSSESVDMDGGSHPSTNNDFNVCGWIIQTTERGAGVVVDCDVFELKNQASLLVKEPFGDFSNRYMSSSDGPQSVSVEDTVRLILRYSGTLPNGRFSCKVTATQSAAPSTAAITPSDATYTSPWPAATTTPPAVAPANSSCRCGIANNGNRIVGGSETAVNENPWQVGLIGGSKKNVFCGGTLISKRFILTAAHCTPGLTLSNFRLLLAGHSTSSVTPGEKIVHPLRIIPHSQYNDETFDNDVALIEIAPVDFSAALLPACLPVGDTYTYASVAATVSGWGTLSSGGTQPTVLHDVTVPTLTNAKCESAYGKSQITANMLCAGAEAGGKDSCQGDSGGPLVTHIGGNYVIIGVVSWGYGCAEAQYPGVYARVSKYTTWIASTTSKDSTCPR